MSTATAGRRPAAVRAAASVMPAIPRGAGDRRLAQAVYRRWLSGRSPVPVSATVGGARMDLDLGDWPQAQAYLLRRYDSSTVAFVRQHLPEGGVFVDGGSHVGLISMQVARIKPSAEIHAFEPHPVKHAALTENAARNSAKLVANRLGLSDVQGDRTYDADRHAVAEDGGAEIPVTRLDAYAAARDIDRIDVVKLDVEGHELSALKGASALLEAGAIRAITLESLHGETSAPIDYLGTFGYKRVSMPDTRPRWLAARRPMPVENVGFVLPRVREA